MRSFLLFSVVLAALAIPLVAARDPRPARGLWRMLVVLLAFNVLYVAYLVTAHVTLFVPHWP